MANLTSQAHHGIIKQISNRQMPVRTIVLVIVGKGGRIRKVDSGTSGESCSSDFLLLAAPVFGGRRGRSFSGGHILGTSVDSIFAIMMDRVYTGSIKRFDSAYLNCQGQEN